MRGTWMKRTASIAFGSLLLVAPGEALARSRHFDNWVFGSGCTMTWDATLNRSIGARNTVLSTFEGTSTWSDPLTGALQLMTDGIQVFSSSNTEVTSAGTRLGGNPSAAQSGLVLPVPGQPGRYYVFAVPASQGTGNNGGLTVSKFNLTGANPVQESAVFTLNNGQLDIGEMLTVVANPNGRDYWVIATRATTNTNGEILVYNISTTALSNATAPARVVAVGGAGGGPNISRTGNRPVFGIAASPDGKRLAAATFEEVDLWDFNANTGDVTNGRVLRTSATTYHYGVAFSPDSSKLYVNGLYGTDAGRLMQFNLAAGNAFFDYGFLPAGNVGNGAGAMALGPDRRIYISTYAVGNKLSVIQNPNAAGAAAMYQANAVDVSAGCNTFFSLPTSINAFARLDALDPDADGDGIRDTQDADADGDGIPNRLELGGDDVAKDTDGDGVPDFKDKDQMGALCTDANTDGICDNIPVKYDTDGDGIPNHLDLDADNDGIPDLWENGGKALDANGDGRVDNTTDTDKDGLADVVDAAPADAANTTPKTTPVDSDGDGTLDAYELDSDGDGVFDIVETGQTDANRDGKVDGAFSDIDRDGLADAIDPDEGGSVKATLQDSDADGKADFQDTDDDGDTVLTKDELGAGGGANPVDTDGDGKRDYLDPDDDNDSILTKDEVADGKLAKVNKDDVDGDGKKNWLDDDADNDGKKDGVDGSAPRADDNGDGIPEYLQAAGATAEDSDGDGVPNTRETEIGTNPNNPDSDGDGVRDGDELGSGATPRDTDGDGKIDALDDDDDGDGVLTKQEIADAKAAGKSDDVDGDGKKNWLDNDADGDGVLDGAEASDSDGDGVPDYLIGLNGGASSSGDVNAPGSVEGGGCNTGGADANSLAPIALALVGLLRRRRTRR